MVIVWVVDAQHHTVVCSNYSVKHACSYVLCIAIVLHSTIEPMSHVWYELGAGKVRNCRETIVYYSSLKLISYICTNGLAGYGFEKSSFGVRQGCLSLRPKPKPKRKA